MHEKNVTTYQKETKHLLNEILILHFKKVIRKYVSLLLNCSQNAFFLN